MVVASHRAAGAVGPARRARLAQAHLYFVTEATVEGRSTTDAVAGALDSGAGIVQLRDKALSDDELIAAAADFRLLADSHDALFVLNDRPDLVRATGADGVHIGQDDADPATVRQELGPNVLIGLSTHSRDQIDSACEAAVADYISVGPVWETPTKPGRAATGLDLVRYAAERATVPFFAIGGIDESNVAEVLDAGARRIVVVRAIRDAADPGDAARSLVAALGSDR